MRGNISDQDLADYALNELPPEERLYVESMLAVSAECRNDVYEMIEMAQMIEEGFEAEDSKHGMTLTGEQRCNVVRVRRGSPSWEKAAALLAAAAVATFALTHPAFWQVEDPAGKMVRASSTAADLVVAAVVPETGSTYRSWEESSQWLTVASDAVSEAITQSPMVCTPPSWLETAQISALTDVTQ